MLRSLWFSLEGLLVAFIGRPILWLIKFLRWPILLAGFFFNNISTYNPTTKTTASEYTFIPALIGIALFAVGSTVARYDDVAAYFYEQKPDS